MRSPRGRRFFSTCLCCDSGPAVSANVDRRTILSGLVAIGLAASASIITRAAPALAPLIDVHHHFVPRTTLPRTEIESRPLRFNGSRKKRSMRWTLRTLQPRSSRSRCLESGSETRRLLAACRGCATNTPLTSLETIADVLVCSR